MDDQATSASRYELLEDLFEVASDLLEGTRDGLVFPLVQHFDQCLDVIAGFSKVIASRAQSFTALGKVFVLLEGFFVDVRVFLQRFVGFVELSYKLKVSR